LESEFRRAEGATRVSGSYMARRLYDMVHDGGLPLATTLLLEEHPTTVCSYTDPSQTPYLGCEMPLSPYTCNANGIGPELVFGHSFAKPETITTTTTTTKITTNPYRNRPFGIVKTVVGGSKIELWVSPLPGGEEEPPHRSSSCYWDALRDNIRSMNGTIEAFVWFQGENDQIFGTPATEYGALLARFVGDVRAEIFEAHRKRWGTKGSPTRRWNAPTEVPVVICELGPWIGHTVVAIEQHGVAPGGIIEAQRRFVEGDPNAVLVNTGTTTSSTSTSSSSSAEEKEDPAQLSLFYHFDAPSQLIIGHRIAEVGSFVCLFVCSFVSPQNPLPGLLPPRTARYGHAPWTDSPIFCLVTPASF